MRECPRRPLRSPRPCSYSESTPTASRAQAFSRIRSFRPTPPSFLQFPTQLFLFRAAVKMEPTWNFEWDKARQEDACVCVCLLNLVFDPVCRPRRKRVLIWKCVVAMNGERLRAGASVWDDTRVTEHRLLVRNSAFLAIVPHDRSYGIVHLYFFLTDPFAHTLTLTDIHTRKAGIHTLLGLTPRSSTRSRLSFSVVSKRKVHGVCQDDRHRRVFALKLSRSSQKFFFLLLLCSLFSLSPGVSDKLVLGALPFCSDYSFQLGAWRRVFWEGIGQVSDLSGSFLVTKRLRTLLTSFRSDPIFSAAYRPDDPYCLVKRTLSRRSHIRVVHAKLQCRWLTEDALCYQLSSLRVFNPKIQHYQHSPSLSLQPPP